MTRSEKITTWFKELQDEICDELKQLDSLAVIHEDIWDRAEGGGGRTRAITGKGVIEKGGVNFSAVHGPVPEAIQKSFGIGATHFYATGVSIVLHPINPWVPIIHMNVRYFETGADEKYPNGLYWFGGGIDLTPHYADESSGKFIHNSLKDVCDAAYTDYYTRFKKWADDYFFIKHRDETRGVGGIFYDHLNESGESLSFDELWQFQQSVGQAFVPIYKYYAELNKNKSYTEAEKAWQMIRRGRYAEFNLVWDRGTKFGLDTGGRTESILMSLPPQANWEYNHQPTEGTPEAETLKWLKKGINWVG
jgi:coproporphyrinogen III oxidase